MTILVTGGTGTLGTHVLPMLKDVRILSRRERDGDAYVVGDLLKGEGVDAAVDGVDVILHLAGGPKGDDVATRNLMDAAAKAGVKHIVYISVIAADQVPLGYFRAKRDAERAVEESGVPWTILRAAQFHDLAYKVAEKMAKLPVIPVPGGMRWQPVDSRDVAERLVELATGDPAGRVRDLAGPKIYTFGELIRGCTGGRRAFLPVRMPGKAGRAYRAGANLTLDGADLGTRTWEDFLAERNAR